MIYDSVKANLYVLLREVRVIKQEQVLRFFRNRADPESLRYLLRVMTARRAAEYSEEDGLLRLPGPFSLSAEEASARVRAFWPLADLGEENVRSLVSAGYPFEFSAVTNGDGVIDIAWIPNLSVARLAAEKIAADRRQFPEDRSEKIAAVPDETLGRRMPDLGFTGFRVVP